MIAIAGMPGSGKAIVSKVAFSRQIPVLVCGDVVREETKRRGLAPTPENTGKVMLAIRREKGPAVVAVVPDEKIDDVRTKWNDHEAKILQTHVNHQKARVTS